MKFINQIKDALKYTIRDWKVLVLLGIILCVSSSLEDMDSNNIILQASMLIIVAIMLIVEEGYRYKVIESTINGNNNPPVFNGKKELMKEGIVEIFTLAIYAIGMFILSGIWDAMRTNTDMQIIVWTFLFIIILIWYMSFLGAAINKAMHGGKIISAFNVVEIFKFYSKIGFFKTVFLIILGTLSLNIIISCIINPNTINIYLLLDYIASFFISPILLLFLTRLMALLGKEANSQ